MRAEAKASARILEFSFFGLGLKVPLAEQPGSGLQNRPGECNSRTGLQFAVPQ